MPLADQPTQKSLRHWHFRVIVGLACALSIGLIGLLATQVIGSDAQPSESKDDRPVIGIQHTGPIKVVYHISEDEMKDGVGKGLFYLRKLHESYLTAGVKPERLDIRAVYHGKAAEHLLTDEAWNRQRNVTTGNPNTPLLAELARRGVHVELCNTRRIKNGWSKSDIHPDVLLVGGAYQRLIDLQLQGYAYIRF